MSTRKADMKKLHLGCFDQVFPGWINTDITPHIRLSKIPGAPAFLFKIGLLPQVRYEQHKQRVFHSVRYLNVTKKFPYPDGFFDSIFSSHLLENLYPSDAEFCLREVHRILKRGGVVRLAVSDLDKIVADYDPKNPDEFLNGIFEAQQKADKNKHRWHYNELSLTQLLNKEGFKEVFRCYYRQGRCPDLYLIDNRPESLFMEAVKS
jgi:SAM-dependent methyltransferase